MAAKPAASSATVIVVARIMMVTSLYTMAWLPGRHVSFIFERRSSRMSGLTPRAQRMVASGQDRGKARRCFTTRRAGTRATVRAKPVARQDAPSRSDVGCADCRNDFSRERFGPLAPNGSAGALTKHSPLLKVDRPRYRAAVISQFDRSGTRDRRSSPSSLRGLRQFGLHGTELEQDHARHDQH